MKTHGNQKHDLTGQQCGRLKVLEKTNKRNSDNRILWRCRCDCGNIVDVSIRFLLTGHTRTCGCSRKEIGPKCPRWKGHGEISKKFFSSVERHARERNLELNITIEDIWKLFLQQNRKCSYTDIELSFPSRTNEGDGTASLDRIDSSKGYVEGNIQWVHKWINIMKWDLTEEEFISFCRLIVQKADGQGINKEDNSMENK